MKSSNTDSIRAREYCEWRGFLRRSYALNELEASPEIGHMPDTSVNIAEFDSVLPIRVSFVGVFMKCPFKKIIRCPAHLLFRTKFILRTKCVY
ncbi:hypothetical protein AGR13a_Lc60009 [Agrobacterium genomosp. 13 str. CFBP 6927]|uniref:Uncharacterized protein n=1 Tax=Agrobacterium genomosp. 13 str. CFBP 6927 TaxID=1183428 RepID=A0ABM9VLM4_9HYPH|nr:hypothetical protein AGR13a_Lc60009 [Agrobacterium genomosp. 13 str. CFBP 6927]